MSSRVYSVDLNEPFVVQMYDHDTVLIQPWEACVGFVNLVLVDIRVRNIGSYVPKISKVQSDCNGISAMSLFAHVTDATVEKHILS